MQNSMEHNAAFTALPIEIHHKYVRYIDLRDLGALMFTCKEFYELFGTDLQLQKIVYEHTESRVLHNKLRRPIKTLFMENRALYAVKIDEIDVLKYTLPSLSYKDIGSKLRPFTSDPKTLLVTKSSTKKKSVAHDKNLLQKIFDYDASKCFDFLLEAFTSDVVTRYSDEDCQSNEIFPIMLLIAIVCFKPLKALGSPSTLPYQKVLRVFLQHCRKWQDLIIMCLVQNIKIEQPNESTAYSKMVFESLMACSKEFPEFHIDLSRPMGRWSRFQSPYFTVNTLLELVATFRHDYRTEDDAEGGTFKYFMDQGAPLDPEASYLAISLRSSPWSPLSLFLEKIGCDINALLKPANETLLNSVLSTGWYQDKYVDLNIRNRCKLSFLEYILYRGAKLTKEEAAHWLNTDRDQMQYKAAVCQQTLNYNPLKNIGSIPQFNSGYYRFYCDYKQILLYPDAKFKDYIAMRSGFWEVRNGQLILQDTHKKGQFGNYDEDTMIEGDAPPIRIYNIVTTCLGEPALASNDPNMTEDRKVRQLLFGVHYDLDTL